MDGADGRWDPLLFLNEEGLLLIAVNGQGKNRRHTPAPILHKLYLNTGSLN